MVVMLKLILCVCLAGASSLARAEPLTFDATLQIATRASPEIAEQGARVAAARSASIAAGRLPDPRLAVGIENLPVTGSERWSLTQDFMTMRKVGMMQDIPNRAKREAQTAAAFAAVGQAQAERRVSILTVRRNAAVAWLERYYLERRGKVLDELARENDLFSAAVQAQFAAGRGTPADIVAPRQEAADIADRRDELSGEIAGAKAMLKRWVGAAGDEPLAGEPPPMTLDVEELRGHVHEHPDLAVFVPMTQMAQAQVREAQAAKRPDWGVELAYGRRGSAFSDMVTLEFTLGLPIFPGTRQDPGIAAKREELVRVEAAREAMFRDHTQRLEADLAEYTVLTSQLARLRTEHLPLAREKVEAQLISYRAGKGDLAAVLSARRELIDERLKEVELDGRRATQAARLYYFYGAGAAEVTAADVPAAEIPAAEEKVP
ncbi:MAG: TolC family protein [Proteobacteria bacterium]|nr:TolC family protein [Pseudomonadota bacterium]